MNTGPFPLTRIRIGGAPAERGRQYGELARERIHAGRAGYEQNFARSGVAWPAAVQHAKRYLDAIERAAPEVLTELDGIAAGAALSFEDVLAMNCRTEIMWARAAQTSPLSTSPLRGECSSFGALPSRTAPGHTWVGQNWDWLVHAADSIVLLEVESPSGPNFVTVVEAGLLAKASLNSAGVGIAVNTLATALDGQVDGLPFHVLLRMLTASETAFDALELLSAHQRASSGHYLVGTEGGALLSLECEPGGVEGVHVRTAEDGLLTHTNHFVSRTTGTDLAPLVMPDSYVRQQRLGDLLALQSAATVESIGAALSDHTDAPGSLCCHPDERVDERTQWSTLASLIMDLDRRVIHLAAGTPCTTPHRELDFGELLAPPLAEHAMDGALR